MALLRLLVLPLRAPMLLVLLLVCIYQGLHWADVARQVANMPAVVGEGAILRELFWPLQCAQAVLVVVLCTMPDLLLRELSLMMSSSKALTLVVTLLVVITGGLYLMHLSVFAEVLVLACAVLLARLDLTRLRIVPPAWLAVTSLSLLVLAGVWIGKQLHVSLDHVIG
ncbi:hypothetical protein KBY76_06075 [Synechococcus sp. GreenBA-s]|jgi:hypothetical protein|nr:hypothetical protein [Synechococcus sp. GreenBA-s]